jgi:hypothetical protein
MSHRHHFILQRSVNPLSPRPFGLIALRNIKAGSTYRVVTSPVPKQNNNGKQKSTTSSLIPLTIISENNNNNNNDFFLPYQDLSAAPQTLYDLLFRRYLWRMKNTAMMELDESESTNEQEIFLPPPFLFLPTDSTVLALTNPRLVAAQILDAATNSDEQEQKLLLDDEQLMLMSSEDSTATGKSNNNNKHQELPRFSITLPQILNINDACSIPVPVPESPEKRKALFDPNFWRSFQDLMSEYEQVSTREANCVLEIVEGKDELDFQTVTENQIRESFEQNQLGKLETKNNSENDFEDDASSKSLEERLLRAREKYMSRLRGRKGPNRAYVHREKWRQEEKKRLLLKQQQGDAENVDEWTNQENFGHDDKHQKQQTQIEEIQQEEEQQESYLVLKVTKDIIQGSEFFLSYGREYWTHFAGACAFTASPNCLPRVRWIEKYLSSDVRDLPTSFPDLSVGMPKRKIGHYYLVDRMNECRASDDAVLAEFTRRIACNYNNKDNINQPHLLLRQTLDLAARNLLERNVMNLLSSQSQQQEDDNQHALVQKAAELAAQQGTEGILAQEISMKNVRSLLCQDIVKSKKSKQ